MLRTSAKGLAVLVLLAALGSNARAQNMFVGAGSTPGGDLLRGEGAAAFGMGVYNYYSAVGNAINVNTFMVFNEYLSAVDRERARRFQARIDHDKKLYHAIQERVDNDPEVKDINRGDALNAKMKQLLGKGSAMRFTTAGLSGDTIRRIPFTQVKTSDTAFSMQRMAPKGKGKWPVAFQDPAFDSARRAYERAFDHALDLIDGKQDFQSIKDVETAIHGLATTLDLETDRQRLPESDKRYIEAKKHIQLLDKMKELLKRKKIQDTLNGIDKFSGTNLGDLLEFMNSHDLQFAVPDNAEEIKLYRKLFVMMDIQLKDINRQIK